MTTSDLFPQRLELAGSERPLPPEHAELGPFTGEEAETVTVYLRPRNGGELDWVTEQAAQSWSSQRRLSREELADRHGADPADVAALQAVVERAGLEVVNVNLGRRAVAVRGPLDRLAQAFGARLVIAGQSGGETYRAQPDRLLIPAELDGVVQAVLGFDQRIQAHTRLRVSAAPSTSYTPPQVAALYDFPTGSTVDGQTIGLVELGGGYKTADLTAYFGSLGLPAPSATAVSVDGGTNSPSGVSGADPEVLLDMEVAGSVASGAGLAVYFAPNTEQGFVDAVSTAVHDTTNHPEVISISWGGPESTWSASGLQQLESAMAAAAAAGVSVTVAAGDQGSTDGVTGGLQHVDFPASSPYALACGGTTLVGSGTTISSEVVWNDLASGGGATGGGVSTSFPLPSWQSQAGVPPSANPGGQVGRGVPDVAGDADPDTGYQIRVDGQNMVVGGTSAVAPLWAGLLTVFNASLGKSVGFVNASLYSATAGFHDITSGSNGAYQAKAGWDACTGLGSPEGGTLLDQLRA